MDRDPPEKPSRLAGASISTRSGGRLAVWVAYALVTLLSLLIGAVATVRTAASLPSAAASDLSSFFLTSAAYIVRGDPWHMYAVRAAPPYTTYPNVDPPLSMFLLAPVLRWATALGLTRSVGAQVAFVSLPFVPLVPVLGGLAAGALGPVRPAMSVEMRVLAFALIGIGPLAWISEATWGHLEQPLMLCFLVAGVGALHARRAVLAGVLVGLALLSGTAALFPTVALVTVLLANQQWRQGACVAGVAGAVVALGFAPFLVVDRHDTIYAFVTWRGSEEIGGNSLWSSATIPAIAHALPPEVSALIRRLDTLLMLALAVGVAFAAVRRLRVSAEGTELWAVLGMAALGLPLLAKVVWPYYYLTPFVLLLIYECGTLSRYQVGVWRWPVLSGGFLLVTTSLTLFVGLPSTGTLDRVVTGLLEFSLMLVALFGTWWRLRPQG